jgi:hypothetical protein
MLVCKNFRTMCLQPATQAFLRIANIDLSDATCETIGTNMAGVREISMDFTTPDSFSLRGLTSLSRLTQLRSLDVAYYQSIDDASLRCISRFHHLEYLNISNCYSIVGNATKHLAWLTCLKTLEMKMCGRVTKVVEYLTNAHRLETLRLSWCDGLCASDFLYLNRLTGLKVVSLRGCKNFDDDGMVALGKLCGITTLDISASKVSDIGLGYIASMTQLTDLGARSLERCTNRGLLFLNDVPDLLSLDITGWTLTCLPSLCVSHGLKVLILNNCGNLTDNGLVSLRCFPNLSHLRLDLTNITNSATVHIRPLKRLEFISLESCTNLTFEERRSLRELIWSRHAPSPIV